MHRRRSHRHARPGRRAPAPEPTRERLLEAAGEVFAARGYELATVREICRAAGANVAAINYHFGDKQTLHHEALRYAFLTTHQQHPSAPEAPGASIERRLQGFVESFLRRLFSAERRWQGRMMARELADPSGGLELVVEQFIRPMFQRLLALIAEARPELDEERRRRHALGLLGQCVFFRHARPVLDLLVGKDAYREPEIPALTRHIVGVFLRGLGIEPETERPATP